MNVGVLFSGGKDSTYAMYKAMKEHNVVCLITLKSENPDSYMFHTPNIDLTEMQAEAIGLPLFTATTKGEKEKELIDLKNAIKKAKQTSHIEGVVTGALWSEYQASRIKNICEELKLECINPLWHMDQEEEMREIISKGFKFILTRIAAYGLDKSYLGKIITAKEVDKLSLLNKKYKTNVAGEGGEFESLVIEGPTFKSKLKIEDAEIIMENEHTGFYKIKKILLES